MQYIDIFNYYKIRFFDISLRFLTITNTFSNNKKKVFSHKFKITINYQLNPQSEKIKNIHKTRYSFCKFCEFDNCFISEQFKVEIQQKGQTFISNFTSVIEKLKNSLFRDSIFDNFLHLSIRKLLSQKVQNFSISKKM